MGTLTNLSLFSGAAGLDLGARLVGGIKTVCYVEFDRYAQGVLMSRIRDGGLDDAPIWDDVTTFDGKPWRGKVDIVSGGFPCQDVSIAGKQVGITKGKRSGLWKEFARIVGEVGPRFVLVENVTGLLMGGGLGVVLGDLASMGFDAQWSVLSAGAVGAPHIRERVFLVAYPNGAPIGLSNGFMGNCREQVEERAAKIWGKDRFGPWLGPLYKLSPERLQQISRLGEPPILRMDDGLAPWVELRIRGALKVTGNGVVSQQATPPWQVIVDMAKNIERL